MRKFPFPRIHGPDHDLCIRSMKLPKLPQTCPEFCMRFYLTKRVGRQSDIIDGLFLFYLGLYILNSAVI